MNKINPQHKPTRLCNFQETQGQYQMMVFLFFSLLLCVHCVATSITSCLFSSSSLFRGLLNWKLKPWDGGTWKDTHDGRAGKGRVGAAWSPIPQSIRVSETWTQVLHLWTWVQAPRKQSLQHYFPRFHWYRRFLLHFFLSLFCCCWADRYGFWNVPSFHVINMQNPPAWTKWRGVTVVYKLLLWQREK